MDRVDRMAQEGWDLVESLAAQGLCPGYEILVLRARVAELETPGESTPAEFVTLDSSAPLGSAIIRSADSYDELESRLAQAQFNHEHASQERSEAQEALGESQARVAELERQIADREAIDVVHHAETMKALADVKRKVAEQCGE